MHWDWESKLNASQLELTLNATRQRNQEAWLAARFELATILQHNAMAPPPSLQKGCDSTNT